MADQQAVAKQNQNLVTMKAILDKYSSQMQMLIPKHVSGEQIVMIAQTALTKNPKLLESDSRTVLAGIIQCSILGLQLHTSLHHASLVPFWNSKAGIFEATLIIEYPGLIELVMRGGETDFVEAQPVYSNDFFEIEYGSNAHLIHRPEFRSNRGELILAYAYAKLKSHDTKFHHMTAEDVLKRRNISKAKDNGPWVDWTAEMWAKTPLRHLCKQLRKTTELSMALAHEERFDSGESMAVVESPTGLSMDFLSMNIDAKTLEQKEALKKRIADKSEQTQAPPPPDTPPAPIDITPTTPQAPPTPAAELKETGDRLAAIKKKRESSGKPGAAPEITPPTATTPPVPAPATEDPDMASLFNQAPEPAPAPVLDELDKTVDGSEVKQVLELIKAKGLQGPQIREQLLQLHAPGKTSGGTNILRELTKRNAAKLVEWINQQ